MPQVRGVVTAADRRFWSSGNPWSRHTLTGGEEKGVPPLLAATVARRQPKVSKMSSLHRPDAVCEYLIVFSGLECR
jgi:hypothetical protein